MEAPNRVVKKEKRILTVKQDGADCRGKRSVVEDWRLCKVYDNDDDEDDSTLKQQSAPNYIPPKSVKTTGFVHNQVNKLKFS